MGILLALERTSVRPTAPRGGIFATHALTRKKDLMTAGRHARASQIATLIVLLLGTMASVVSAETLMMPRRDMLRGTSQVVWGVTTLPGNTPTSPTNYAINLGAGT